MVLSYLERQSTQKHTPLLHYYLLPFTSISGVLAHLAERLLRKQEVGGSTPPYSTSGSYRIFLKHFKTGVDEVHPKLYIVNCTF